MATMTEARKPILDESGKVRQWLEAGRGVTVWESHDIGAGRPDMLTPGDGQRPHWAYVAARTITNAEDCLFYAPGHIVQSWSDTPSGNRAASKALAKMADETRTAPIGTVHVTHTIHRYAMGSIDIRPDADGRTVLQTYGPNKSLVHVEFRVGIRQWVAIDRVEA